MQALLRLRRSGVVALVAVVSCVFAGRSAWGVERVYTLDQNLSIVTASGTIFSSIGELDIDSQGTNNFGQTSLVAKYGGTIRADRQQNAINTIQFLNTGGNAIDTVSNGTWAPGLLGVAGSAPGDYAGEAGNFFASVNLAARELKARLTSGVLPVTGSSFTIAGTTVTFTSGDIDYRVNPILGDDQPGTQSIVGEFGTLGGSTLASISVVPVAGDNLQETLMIPISSTIVIDVNSDQVDSVELTLLGSLRAVATYLDPHERYWFNSAPSSTFAPATNWNPGITPGTADTAVFDLNASHTVNFAASATNKALRIENDQVSFALGAQTYTLTDTEAPSVIVGTTAGSVASLTLSGTTPGTGGKLSSVNASIGNAVSGTPYEGQVTVNAGATWSNSRDLYVGNTGKGTLTIGTGGKVVPTVTNGSGSYIGYASGSTGSSASVAGTWTNDFLYVGHNATGTLTTNSGGVVTSKVASIGYHATGGVTVGSGSSFTNSDVLFVGELATGTMTVQAGGTLNGFTTNIGAFTGSNGAVTVGGTGAVWNNTESVYVGGTFSGAGGQGELKIGDLGTNGTVTVGGTLKTYTNANGTIKGVVNLSGGKLKAATLNISPNTFSQTGGQLVATMVTGDLTRAGGTLTPGDTGAVEQMSITGNYTQQSGATLTIELKSNTEYDSLSATGTATLLAGTTLQLSKIGGYVPTYGNIFPILTAALGVSGTFAPPTLPSIPNTNLEWILKYGATSVTLSVGLVGDFNRNGVVDAADYVVWRKTGGTPTQYTQWRSHFGVIGSANGSGSSLDESSTSVPEPGTLALFAMAWMPLFGCGLRRRRRA